MGTRLQGSNLFRMQFAALGEVPQCDACKHLFADGDTCTAFPDGIPSAIMINVHDHHAPFEGDHGILFEEGEPAYISPYRTPNE